jgi:hypothetical protein
MQLVFSCQKETAKFNVSAANGAVEPKDREEMVRITFDTARHTVSDIVQILFF